MTTSPTTQDTTATGTPVQLPDLSLSTYRALVADLAAQYPAAQQQARIGRALDVLLGAELRATEQAGVFLVQSCKDSTLYYRASGLHCGCPDHLKHPELTCKHSAAVQVLCSASALASFERRQAGEPTPPPPAVAVCRACGREGVAVDAWGACDLCALVDSQPIAYCLTEEAEALLAALDAPVVA